MVDLNRVNSAKKIIEQRIRTRRQRCSLGILLGLRAASKPLTLANFPRVALLLTLLLFASITSVSAAAVERLSVVYCENCVPFHYRDNDGKPAGLIIDYWHLWSEKTGISVDFVAAPWNETLKMVGDGVVDAHAGLFFSEERDQYLDYGTPLRQTDTHVFFHQTIPATTHFQELAAYRIGVVSGDYVEGYLKEHVPDGLIVGYTDYAAIIEALRSGALKVFAADTPTGLYHLKQAGLLASFSYVADGPLYRSDWFTAAREGDAATIEMINQGMVRITDAEKREIGRRWVGDSRDQDKGDVLVIAMDRGYSPFTFMNAQGQPAGLFVDIWRAWADKTGRKIRFRISGWAETLQALEMGEADIHSGLSYSDARAQWVGFSNQIYRTASRVYHRAGEGVPADIGAFDDRVLGVEADTYQEAEIHRQYPGIRLQSYATSTELVRALVSKEIDAALKEDRVMDTILRNMGLQGSIVARPERLLISTIHAGVLKDRTELLAEMNAGLSQLTDNELAKIEARWIVDSEHRFHGRGMNDADVGLTRAERVWLNDHPLIRLGADQAWPPYEYVDGSGAHRGLSAGFVSRIGEILGITFRPPEPLPWAQTVEHAKTGRLDLLAAVAPTPERAKFLIFSHPYMSWFNVIATRSDTPGIAGVEDLEGKRVGVVEGYVIHEILSREHPDVEIIPYKDIPEGLRALTNGTLDAFVDSPVTISHFSQQMQLDDVVLVAATPYKLELALAVRKDWPELAAILDKVLAKISPRERQRLLEAAGLSASVELVKTTKPSGQLLSLEEALILAIVIVIIVGVSLILMRIIRTQQRPLFQSLRGKSILFIAGVFLLIGGMTIWTLAFVGERISTQLGQYVAQRHVLWHKEKVLGAVQRELALAKQMAESQVLHRWAMDETNPMVAVAAQEELQRYHDNFKAQSYFIGLTKSKHFFFANEKATKVELEVVDTLSPDDEDDIWFFKTIKDKAPYNLNVDHNVQLSVTNLWVNYAMRRSSETLGVVGTGIRLTEFINDFVSQETKGITSMMIDGGGAIQAHMDPAQITHNVLGQESGESVGIWRLLSLSDDRKTLRRNMAQLREGTSDAATFFLELDGKRTLVAMAYLQPLNWYTLALFEPGSMVGLHEMGTLVAVLGISLLITVIAFIIGQNQLIVHPLDQLSRGALRMSSGDYDVRLPVAQRDEIGDLTQIFNGMATIIADYTGNLENKVAERTHELSEAYGVIRGSIQYASRIQHSVIPDTSLLEEHVSGYFVYWEPRDVVGGDIYWNYTWGDGLLVILGDCTGHGVPGAFMTLIVTGALNRARMEVPQGDIAALVQRMHQLTQITLRQNTGHSESDDGMELGVCYLPFDMSSLKFTGARFELFILDNGQVKVIKGTKRGIGYCSIPLTQEYGTQTICVHKGMRFYMTSDGLIDQIGGPKRRSFGKNRFKQLIVAMEHLPMKEQKERLQSTLQDFQGQEMRRDDVSVIGFEI